MSFWDEVYKLRAQGLIPRVWTRAHLRPHLQGQYKRDTITTVPSNASMSRDGKQVGDYIKRGRQPKAWRVGRGEFRLIIDPADDASAQDAEHRRAAAYTYLAKAIAAGDPYPLRGLPLKYDRPFDPVAFDD